MHQSDQQQHEARNKARKGRDGSVPGRNANGDDILTADDRAALEVVLADQDKAKVEPAERLERHFRAGHFILRGDTYATLKSNGHMGKMYARAAAEWIRASGIDRHPLLRRKGTRTNLRKMAKHETGIWFWFEHLNIDDQIKFGHPDTIMDRYYSFLSAIFTAAGFVSSADADWQVWIVDDNDEEETGETSETGEETEATEEEPAGAHQQAEDAADEAEAGDDDEAEDEADQQPEQHTATEREQIKHDLIGIIATLIYERRVDLTYADMQAVISAISTQVDAWRVLFADDPNEPDDDEPEPGPNGAAGDVAGAGEGVEGEASAPRGRRKKSPPLHKATLADAIDEAFGGLSGLAEEMQSWADNMPESLQGGSKYEAVSGTAETLSNLEQPDVPESLSGLEVEYNDLPPRSRGYSRSDRHGQACYILDTCIDLLRERENDDEASELAEELQSAMDEAENVEFPGMFG
jgi:hypothetical protein